MTGKEVRRIFFKIYYAHKLFVAAHMSSPTSPLTFIMRTPPKLKTVHFATMAQHTLVENMVKKNRSRFPIVVLLITMLCSRYTNANLFSLTYQLTLWVFWVLKIPFQRKCPKTFQFAVAKWKINFCSGYVTGDRDGQKNGNAMGERLRFFFTMFSTTIVIRCA